MKMPVYLNNDSTDQKLCYVGKRGRDSRERRRRRRRRKEEEEEESLFKADAVISDEKPES